MSARVKDVITSLNQLAPEDLAQDWDNVGLQIGSLENKVSTILLALDGTLEVIQEAINLKADMIITHHPMIFSPLTKITNDTPQGKKIYQLINHNINLYTLHTNFDTAFGGTNDILANKIGLKEVEVINPNSDGMGIGRMGNIKRTSIKELVHMLKKELQVSHIRAVGDLDQEVTRVAICTGSGMGFIKSVIGKVDILITGDVKFHEAQEAKELGINVLDVGHYYSENIAMPSIKDHMEQLAKEHDIEILVSQINGDPFITI